MTSMQLLAMELLNFTFIGNRMTKSRVDELRGTLERALKSGETYLAVKTKANGDLPKIMNFPNNKHYAVLGEKNNGVAIYHFKGYENSSRKY